MSGAQRPNRMMRPGLALGLLAGMMLLAASCQAYVLDADVVQARLDVATPPLDGIHTVSQSFACHRSNLCEIELLPAVYETPDEGVLTWRLVSLESHTTVAQESIDVATVRPNVPLRLSFPAQADSRGRSYELSVEGSAGARVGLWYSSFDAYGGGQLHIDGSSYHSADLRFTTRCRYDLGVMVEQVLGRSTSGMRLLLPLLLVLLLPGYALMHRLGLARGRDPVAVVAVTVSLSLAVVPITLLWSSVIGLRWHRAFCQVTLLFLALHGLLRLFRNHTRDLSPWLERSHRALVLTMLPLMGLTLLLRFVQIRDLVLPAWVDSPQHVLVSQLLDLHGRVPASYEPLLPVGPFAYHFGFHADTVLFSWLSSLPIPQAMLILGQVLNAACTLTAYLLAQRLTGRKLGGIVASTIVGLASYMPAYYASWGRYTQLTGLVLLPATVVVAWEWLEGEKRDYRRLAAAALLQAGLFLTHARVSVFAASFVLAYLLLDAMMGLRVRSIRWEHWRRAGLLAIVSLAACGPWLGQIAPHVVSAIHAARSGLHTDSSHTAASQGLLFIPRNRELMIAAAMGVLAGLWRRRRETTVLLLWCGVVALAASLGWLGLPITNLVTLAAAVISLFLPLAALIGEAVTFAWDIAPHVLASLAKRLGFASSTAGAARGALAVLLVALGLCSGWGLVSVINPGTILATAEDLEALAWIGTNTPREAIFAINTGHWQLGVYTGTDGGYWIPQLTGRRTLLPAIPYVYGSQEYVQHVTDMARIISEMNSAQDSGFRSLLEKEGVTHIYIGARGGPMTPKMFLDGTEYRVAYSSGSVWIFEVVK